MVITASLVKELRERTGAGMMECKKALEGTNGDIEAAIVAMRKAGQAKAAQKAGRIAAEGAIAIQVSSDKKQAIIVEINCETDFVARDHNFLAFVTMVATKGLAAAATNLDTLLAVVVEDNKTIAQMREELVGKIGENITIRRVQLVTTEGTIGSYVHNNNRIGVVVELLNAQGEIGKEVAMHIAANRPLAVTTAELAPELLAKEREIYLAQVQDSGKPPEILEKMVTGRMQKFIAETVLDKQQFVKDPSITVEKLLAQAGAKVVSFIRFEVGEGIAKPAVDFAREVHHAMGKN